MGGRLLGPSVKFLYVDVYMVKSSHMFTKIYIVPGIHCINIDDQLSVINILWFENKEN